MFYHCALPPGPILLPLKTPPAVPWNPRSNLINSKALMNLRGFELIFLRRPIYNVYVPTLYPMFISQLYLQYSFPNFISNVDFQTLPSIFISNVYLECFFFMFFYNIYLQCVFKCVFRCEQTEPCPFLAPSNPVKSNTVK